MVSTINGDANVPFYKELGNQGIKAKDIPVVAFSVGEEELAGIDTKPLVGHLAAWNYFSRSTRPPTRRRSSSQVAGLHQEPEARHQRPDGSALIGFNMWVEGGREGRHHRSDKVIDAIIGVAVPEPDRRHAEMLPNHHITKPVLIGEIQGDGQFDVCGDPGLWSATNGRTTCRRARRT